MSELVDDIGPTVVCLVETLIQKEEEIIVRGYQTICRADETSNNILIVIKNNTKTIIMEIGENSEIGQLMWILLVFRQPKNKIKNMSTICTPIKQSANKKT